MNYSPAATTKFFKISQPNSLSALWIDTLPCNFAPCPFQGSFELLLFLLSLLPVLFSGNHIVTVFRSHFEMPVLDVCIFQLTIYTYSLCIDCVIVCAWLGHHQLSVCQLTSSRFSCLLCKCVYVWWPVLSVGSDWIGLKMAFLPLLWWWQLNTVCLVPRWCGCVLVCLSIYTLLTP